MKITVKKSILHALTSSVFAIIASLIYNNMYTAAFDINFDSVFNAGGIIGACIFGCTLMAVGYFLGYRWKGEKAIGILNIAISVLSFASIVGVLAFQLPMNVDSPELFPGLAIPMHFFPALSFLVVYPFFKPKYTNS